MSIYILSLSLSLTYIHTRTVIPYLICCTESTTVLYTTKIPSDRTCHALSFSRSHAALNANLVLPSFNYFLILCSYAIFNVRSLRDLVLFQMSPHIMTFCNFKCLWRSYVISNAHSSSSNNDSWWIVSCVGHHFAFLSMSCPFIPMTLHNQNHANVFMEKTSTFWECFVREMWRP